MLYNITNERGEVTVTISVNIAEPVKLNKTQFEPLSAFISFPYEPTLYTYINSLPKREYHSSGEWEIPLSQLSKFCDRFTNHDIKIVGTFKRVEDYRFPKGFTFKTKPFNHQIESVLYGLENDLFILGDEQGLGKTKSFIDTALALKARDGIKHALIICGVAGNKDNWVEEIKIHSNEESWILGTRFTKTGKSYVGTAQQRLDDLTNLPKAFFIITNIETLRLMSYKDPKSKAKKHPRLIYPIAEKIDQLCEDGTIGIVGVDEIHQARNPESQQGEALLKIVTDRGIAMSGTPLINNPLDAYLPLHWLGYETHDFWQFKHHYCILGGMHNQDVVGYKNMDELRKVLDCAMLRRLKKDVLDLPEKLHHVEYVEMYKDQAKIYDEVKKALKQDIDKIRLSPDPLAQLIRLRQATGYPGILSTKITESAKMDRLLQLVDSVAANGGKSLVFSNWEAMSEVARKKLAKFNPAFVTGQVKQADRMDEINRFQKDSNCKVIIGTIGALGTGYTLTAANSVFFLDSPWNPATKDQASDRAHRIGTTGTVNVVTLVCKDTIDEIIEEIIYKKGVMIDWLVDGRLGQRAAFQLIDRALS